MLGELGKILENTDDTCIKIEISWKNWKILGKNWEIPSENY